MASAERAMLHAQEGTSKDDPKGVRYVPTKQCSSTEEGEHATKQVQ